MMFEQEQASYLVGLAAGYTTESNIVGFVTGAANETMNSFGYGYCAGVLDANPDATILQYNANNFGDASGGKTAVNTMVTKGADVVFHAAGVLVLVLSMDARKIRSGQSVLTLTRVHWHLRLS